MNGVLLLTGGFEEFAVSYAQSSDDLKGQYIYMMHDFHHVMIKVLLLDGIVLSKTFFLTIVRHQTRLSSLYRRLWGSARTLLKIASE
jgi:hypothetical protein